MWLSTTGIVTVSRHQIIQKNPFSFHSLGPYHDIIIRDCQIFVSSDHLLSILDMQFWKISSSLSWYYFWDYHQNFQWYFLIRYFRLKISNFGWRYNFLRQFFLCFVHNCYLLGLNSSSKTIIYRKRYFQKISVLNIKKLSS